MARNLIAANSLPSVPWKNGGGTTREVLKFPLSSTIETFDWRISIAAVAASGPFSLFPDIDRTMIVADGEGIELDDKKNRIVLGQADEPFSFPGEIPYYGTLADGPIADVNVMTRRTRYSHSMRRHRSAGKSIDRGNIRVIVALADGVSCAFGSKSLVLAKLDSLLVDGQESVAVASVDWLEIEIARHHLEPKG
jgi:uncharacterized protein